MSISAIFSQFQVFGFSGSRSCGSAAAEALSLLAFVPRSSAVRVSVGCASGVDAVIRGACRALPFQVSVFEASQFLASSYAGRLALRSSACVSSVSGSGLWCSFPSSSCPPSLVPCASPFSGSGSGSWASLCLAVFQGSACFVSLPAGVSPPSWFRSWGFVPVSGSPSCFYRPAVPPSPSLF